MALYHNTEYTMHITSRRFGNTSILGSPPLQILGNLPSPLYPVSTPLAVPLEVNKKRSADFFLESFESYSTTV